MKSDIKLKSKLGDIRLIKPSNWTLGISENVWGKLELNRFLFAKYVLYYSQRDSNSDKKYGFDVINKLHFNEVISILSILINSDEVLLYKINKGKKFIDSLDAYNKFRKYIDTFSKKIGTSLIGIFYIVQFYHNWILALNGELKKRQSITLKNIELLVKNIIESNPEFVDSNIKNYFNEFKGTDYIEEYINICNKVNNLTMKIKEAGLWIPSRYQNKFLQEIKNVDTENISRNELEGMILKHLDNNDLHKILNKWKKSFLFSEYIIIEQAFQCYELKLYAPSITCLLTQLDRIILEFVKHIKFDSKIRKTDKKVLEFIITYIESKVMNKVYISEYFPNSKNFDKTMSLIQFKSLSNYLKNIVFEDTNNINESEYSFNRHGILHGIFRNYHSQKNSKTLILLIDEFVNFYNKLPNYSTLING